MQNRLKNARLERGLSSSELSKLLNIHVSTLNNWESGRREINLDKLMQLAKVLDFSVGYLLGLEDPLQKISEPVSKEKLLGLHGQPIWSASLGWGLVNVVDRTFTLYNGQTASFNSVTDELFQLPPLFQFSLHGIGAPLSLDEVSASEKIWLEPVTTDIKLQTELRGYYYVYDNRLVQNEFSARFYFDKYGVNWLAFKDCIE